MNSPLVEQAATSSDIPTSETTRRSFLHRSVKAGLVAVPAALVASSVADRPAYAARGRNGHNGAQYYPNLFPGSNGRAFKEIQSDEEAHVAFILASLGSLARPKPTFQGLDAPDFKTFIQMSATFENTGAGAYLGAAPFILEPLILADAASIAEVESYHSGFLNTLLNGPILPGGTSFAQPLTRDQVAAALTPYIVSLNGGPPASYDNSGNRTADNDVAIVNFALIAEYLEREFYDLNVPKFFS